MQWLRSAPTIETATNCSYELLYKKICWEICYNVSNFEFTSFFYEERKITLVQNYLLFLIVYSIVPESCKVMEKLSNDSLKNFRQIDLVPHYLLKLLPHKKIRLLVSKRTFEFSYLALSSIFLPCSIIVFKRWWNFPKSVFLFLIIKNYKLNAIQNAKLLN